MDQEVSAQRFAETEIRIISAGYDAIDDALHPVLSKEFL